MFEITTSTADYMSLVLTHQCQLQCPYCVDLQRGQPGELSGRDVRRAIIFAKAKGIKHMLLVGGEPTLHPKVVDIAARLKDEGFVTTLTTNYLRPLVVTALDGVLDNLNISWHQQEVLPWQDDWHIDITLSSLIYVSSDLSEQHLLDDHIDHFGPRMHLKYSTLEPCNEWAGSHQGVSYLDGLNCQWVVLFNEILGQVYRGAVIKRYDRIINAHSHQSWKMWVDGTISQSWPAGGDA